MTIVWTIRYVACSERSTHLTGQYIILTTKNQNANMIANTSRFILQPPKHRYVSLLCNRSKMTNKWLMLHSVYCCHGLRKNSQWCRKVLGWKKAQSPLITHSLVKLLWHSDIISLDEQSPGVPAFYLLLSTNSIYKQQIWLLCGFQTKLITLLLCCLLVIESQMNECHPHTCNKDTNELLGSCQPISTHPYICDGNAMHSSPPL